MQRKNVVGSGARRIVFDLSSGYVIKLAKSADGRRSNRAEVKLYRSLPRRAKKYLARIKSYGAGYSWLLMKKYSRPFPYSARYRRRLGRMRVLFRRFGILPYEVVGRKTGQPNYQNLRLRRNGNIVIIDYGNFRRGATNGKPARTSGLRSGGFGPVWVPRTIRALRSK